MVSLGTTTICYEKINGETERKGIVDIGLPRYTGCERWWRCDSRSWLFPAKRHEADLGVWSDDDATRSRQPGHLCVHFLSDAAIVCRVQR